MSGPFGAGGLQLFGAGGFYPYSIDQSLRFEDGDNPYLSKTFSSSGGTIFTFSCWVKIADQKTSRCLLQGYADSNNFAQIVLYGGSGATDGYVGMYSATSGTARLFAYTQALQRDPSAWYHIVVKFNGTSGSEEFKIYINGENQTLTTSTALSAHQSKIGNNNAHYIGNNFNQSLDMNGYMAEVNFIDGTALDASSFGETKAGIWIPKQYSGSYGTNGFYLDFADGSALGDDESGNTNDFTASGLAATDVVLDSPTNNWCTVNPVGSLGTQSEGNLKTVTVGTGSGIAVGSMGHTSGKWYWEVNINTSSTADLIGVVDETLDSVNSSSYPGYLAGGGGEDSIAYYSNGNKYINGTGSSYGATFTTGDIIGVALNLDDNEITFYKNNSSQGTISYTFSGGNILPASSDGTNTSSALGTFTFNFGQDSSFAGTETAQGNTDGNGKGDFYYSPPSGFLALCSANLPNPGIDPAQDEEPADYFNTVIYTGNGTADRAIDVGFATDFFWVKQRSSTNSHQLTDSVRGALKGLHSNSTNVENTFDSVRSFTSTGVTVGTSATTNANAATYVAWNWLAGGTASSNTDGSITSSVSANTEAGFSIVTYTGNLSSTTTSTGASVGHGLSSPPDLIITKRRTGSFDWDVRSSELTSFEYRLNLNNTGTPDNLTSYPTASPTSSVFYTNYVSTQNISGEDYVAYCFHSVDGYSKVGSYTGNGSSNGAFVYTGFRPAWVLVKVTSVANRWVLFDSARSPTNPVEEGQELNPDDSTAEGSSGTDCFDFLSNGFKLRRTGDVFNTSGYNYIYLAFAEQPFKYANAR